MLPGFSQSMEQIPWNNWGKGKVSIKSISNSGSVPGPELAMENSEINEVSICLPFNFSSSLRTYYLVRNIVKGLIFNWPR